jgi:hypothetical protein
VSVQLLEAAAVHAELALDVIERFMPRLSGSEAGKAIGKQLSNGACVRACARAVACVPTLAHACAVITTLLELVSFETVSEEALIVTSAAAATTTTAVAGVTRVRTPIIRAAVLNVVRDTLVSRACYHSACCARRG